ncbi:MAG: zinc-binding dehydrogenase [Hasllibacter sp.]
MGGARTRSGGLCLELARAGAPDEAFRAVRREAPAPARGEIAVRVAHAGVAFADVKMRRGLYPGAPAFPFVPGYDFAGTVTGVGAGVTGFAEGDRVAGLSFTGSYAEHIALAPRYVAKLPTGAATEAAAALVLNYVTAHQMLHRIAKVPPGATILVQGGGGGAGSALLDLARAGGITAYATASKGKHDLVRRYGGRPIDYRAEDFVAVMRAAGGADAAFDPIGGGTLLRSAGALRRGGRVVAFGFAGATRAEDERAHVRRTYLNFLRLKAAPGVRASFYGILTPPFSRRRHIAADLRALLALLAEGRIAPHVGRVRPLARAPEAHRLLEDAAVEGKILLAA